MANAAEAEKAMEAIVQLGDGDPESAHQQADGILFGLLRDLGYLDLLALYERVPKWYA